MSVFYYSELTYKVRGAIFQVRKTLGSGHKETIYHKALIEEFKKEHIPFETEKSLDVKYLGKLIGNYRPDFIIENKVIIEIKAVSFMPKSFESQLIHYLKTTGYKIGLLINFGGSKLFIKRLIWTEKID